MSGFYRFCQIIIAILLIVSAIKNLYTIFLPALIVFFILEGLVKLDSIISNQNDIKRLMRKSIYEKMED